MNDTTNNNDDFLNWVKTQKMFADIAEKQRKEAIETENYIKQEAIKRDEFFSKYIQQKEERIKNLDTYEQKNIKMGLMEYCDRELTALCTESKLKDLTFYKLLPFIPVGSNDFEIAVYPNDEFDIANCIRPKRGQTQFIETNVLNTEEIELDEYCLANFYDKREYDLYGERIPVNIAFKLRRYVLKAVELETALKLRDYKAYSENNKITLTDDYKFNNPDFDPLPFLKAKTEEMESKTAFISNVNLVISQSVWNVLKENPFVKKRFDGNSSGGITADGLKEYLDLSGDVLIGKQKYKKSYVWGNDVLFALAPAEAVNMPENNGVGNIYIHEKYPQILHWSDDGKIFNLEYTTLLKVLIRNRNSAFLIKDAI